MFVIQTNHFVNKTVTEFFAKGCYGKLVNINDYYFKDSDTLATYGILRGTGELLKKAKNFYYIDHGYFALSNRTFVGKATIVKELNGYFKIIKNDFVGFIKGNFDSARLKKINLEFKPKRTSGEFIILSVNTDHTYNFFGVKNWVENTINELKKYTDRKIYLHKKDSEVPLDYLFKKAWAFVSFSSSAGFTAMINGVPAYFTHKNLKNINSINNIEKGDLNYDIFKNLSYSQWTLNEMSSGEAWDCISKK